MGLPDLMQLPDLHPADAGHVGPFRRKGRPRRSQRPAVDRLHVAYHSNQALPAANGIDKTSPWGGWASDVRGG
ncbi:MAG: hypothetical protein D6753_05195 [Planctomycetota bacterium]|nr:MAG: hypothetical protein D6753_05195 [Planctomycetota bacterium]